MKINNMSQMGTVCKLKIKTHFQLKTKQTQVQETKSSSISNFCKQQIPIPVKTKPIKINITLEIGNHSQNGDMGFCSFFTCELGFEESEDFLFQCHLHFLADGTKHSEVFNDFIY